MSDHMNFHQRRPPDTINAINFSYFYFISPNSPSYTSVLASYATDALLHRKAVRQCIQALHTL